MFKSMFNGISYYNLDPHLDTLKLWDAYCPMVFCSLLSYSQLLFVLDFPFSVSVCSNYLLKT